MKLTIGVALLAFAVSAAVTAQTQEGSMEGWHNVMDYGAAADGETDDTAAVQKAIDAATEKGGVVYLPPGRFLVAGRIEVKEAVCVKGSNQAPQAIAPLKGTVVMATAGRGDEDAPPLFHLTHSSSVIGLTVWYPEQKPDDIQPYPWTFQLEGFDTTLENVTLINSYNGVRTGPGNNVRHRIMNLYGCCLRRGIFVDFCTDIGRIDNCQIHCHWWSDPATGGDWEPVFEYMTENLEAFVLGRTDWEYVTNNFVFPAKIGYRFIKTEHGMSNGHITGCGADACQTSFQVDAIQPMGLLVTGGQWVAFAGEEPVQVRIGPEVNGSVRFVNCSFWGPSHHNAILDGKGQTSFSDCYFANWHEDVPDNPILIVNDGRVQVQNSTFPTGHPAVRLNEGVEHAIIRGNNGPFGVRVQDHTGGRALVSGNEPPPDQDAFEAMDVADEEE